MSLQTKTILTKEEIGGENMVERERILWTFLDVHILYYIYGDG